MSFYPRDLDVPDILEHEEFVLLPLTPAHVQVDYEAVMASREMLRLWSGSEWPREGFTLAENLDDLVWHDEEHRDRVAFTYTVLDRGQESCLGCVYIRPLSDLVGTNPGRLMNIGEDEAITRFWVRSSGFPSGLDQRLLVALIDWFAQKWRFSRLFFHTRQANLQQIALFEAAQLERHMALQYSQRGGTHYCYGAVPIFMRQSIPRLPQETFETLVVEAVASLPVYFQEKLENIEILVATWPTATDTGRAGISPGSLLLGLYQGIPLTERTHYYNLVPPDTITLYQGPIEIVAGDDYKKIKQQVRHTVVHEVAHHFGISDARLRELGAY